MDENSISFLRNIQKEDYTLKEFQEYLSKNLVNLSKITYPSTGDSVLHICARLSHIEILKYILTTNPEYVNIKNLDSKTPLHEAAQFSQHKAVEVLLDHGAEVNAIKRADWTPLMLACTKNTQEAFLTVDLLIKNGALVNLCNKDGWNALHLAAREGNENIVNLLIKSDESCIKQKTKNGRSVLHIACLHGHLDIVRILLNYLPVNVIDNCGNTLLHEATFSGKRALIDFLLSKNLSQYSINNIGFTCLHLAASEGNLNLVHHFVTALRMDVNLTSKGKLTPLHCAARKKKIEVVTLLVKLGADIRIKDAHGRSARDYLRL